MQQLRKIILLLLLSATFARAGSAQQLEGWVVAGNKTGLTSISKAQLNRIFQGKESIWKTGEDVVLVMPSAKSETGSLFAEKILNMSYTQLQKRWLMLVFQGRANAPVFQNSNAEMLNYIKNTPGAIGVLRIAEREVDRELIIPVNER